MVPSMLTSGLRRTALLWKKSSSPNQDRFCSWAAGLQVWQDTPRCDGGRESKTLTCSLAIGRAVLRDGPFLFGRGHPLPLPARARLESRVGGGGEGGALSVWPEPFGVYQSRSIQLHVRGAAASPRRTPEPWGHGSSHRRTVRGLCVLSSGFPSPRRVCSSTRLKSTGRQLRARWSAHPVERWKQDTPSPLREPVFARLARLCSGHLPGRRDASW